MSWISSKLVKFGLLCLKVKVDHPTNKVLTKVFYTSDQNLVIPAWRVMSYRENKSVDTRTHRQGRPDTQTDAGNENTQGGWENVPGNNFDFTNFQIIQFASCWLFDLDSTSRADYWLRSTVYCMFYCDVTDAICCTIVMSCIDNNAAISLVEIFKLHGDVNEWIAHVWYKHFQPA